MHFSRFLKMALILGLLSAIGPFAIDMYLPALPDIGGRLRKRKIEHVKLAAAVATA